MKKPALVEANVVLRHLLADDAPQSAATAALFAKAPARSLVISSLTLAEVTWVLLSHYRVPREQVALALQRVLAQSSVQTDAVTREAVQRFLVSKLDFADCVLAAQARPSASASVTFDKDFQRFQDIASFDAKAALARLLGK